MPQERQDIIATTDVVLLTIRDDRLHALLHRRPRGPYQGVWALPGGYIRADEDQSAESAAQRIIQEKAGLPKFYMEQLATWSGPDRDPRGFSLSVVFLILVPESDLPKNMDPDVALHPVDDLPELAFDHRDILAAAVQRLKGKGAYSSLPAMLLPKTFTLSELQRAYEIATGTRIDTSSFRRKILAQDMIVDTLKVRTESNTRNPKLWRLAKGRITFDRTLA